MAKISQLRSRPVGGVRSPAQVLVIVCAGVVLASVDLFVVNVALPEIARDLHASGLGELSWVLNGYTVVYASLLVFFGRLSDRYRRDRAFLVGVTVFTAASAACAASSSVAMLIGFRLVQAAGAALLTPTSLGLVLATYAPDRRHGAVRAWTAVGGVAAALGPVVGGLLVAVSWRWVFLVNVPIGLAALVFGWWRLPPVPGAEAERPDPLGAVLVTAGVGLLSYGLAEGSSWGWTSASTGGILVGAAGLLGLFALHCARSRTPSSTRRCSRCRSFTGASLVVAAFSVSFGAMLLSIVLFEQGVWGWSALRTGLAIAPGPIAVPLVSFLLAGRLIARWGPALVMAAGCAVFGGGVGWWALATGLDPRYPVEVLGGMLLSGIGVGLALPTMMATASASLPAPSFATGSAVVNMVRQTGIVLGVAVLVAVLGGAEAGRSIVALDAFHRGWWVTSAFAFAAIVPALTVVGRRTTPAGRPSEEAGRMQAGLTEPSISTAP